MKTTRMPRPVRLRVTSKGFSLIELMVAMTVGLILIAGLAVLFANSSQTGNDLERSIRQMENGRYAAELLNENISIAGYYGELSGVGLTYATPGSSCATTIAGLMWDNAGLTIPAAVTGFTASQAAALACLDNYKAGTAALALRFLDTSPITASATTTDGNVYLQTSRCATDPNATKFIVSTSSADFTLHDLDCTAINKVQRYVTRIYYVANCNECTGGGIDTIPTLKSAELKGSTITVSPLVEGIEEVAFDYGFDTNGDGTPDTYLANLSGTAGAADNNWANVSGIRLNILSRATEITSGFSTSRTYVLGLAGTRGPFADAFKRRVYTTTTRINNIAGPREIP